MNHWLERSCPICGSDVTVPGDAVSAAHVADEMTFEDVAEFWRGFRKDSCFFTFHRCAQCGLMYCKNYFKDEQLAELYSDMGDNSAGVADAVLERTQNGYFKYFAKYGFKKTGVYLELGPDTGLLTKNFANSGASRMVLIEPNHQVRSQLATSAGGCSDVEIVDDLEALRAGEKFDTITGIHVYDHLVYLSKELSKLASLAADGARILLVVHDENSLLRRLIGKKWPPFCLQHPQLFNPRTLSLALQNSGFEEIKISKSTNWFPIAHIGGMIASLFGLPHNWAKVLPKNELPLRLGNIIVAARKSTK